MRMRSLGSFVLLTLLCSLLLLLVGCGSGGSTAPTDDSFTYVALGDSLAAGFVANEGYVTRYSRFTETDTGATVRLQNLGRPGWKSEDLAEALRNNSEFRRAVQQADIVTWNIGGNDLLGAYRAFLEGDCGGPDNQNCFRTAVSNFQSNWDVIMTELIALRDPETTVLRTMDVYNPFVAEQKLLGIFAAAAPYLNQVNGHIHASAQRNGIPVARVKEAFNGTSGEEDPRAKGLIAPDGFHANDAGHETMAELLRDLGYAPLR